MVDYGFKWVVLSLEMIGDEECRWCREIPKGDRKGPHPSASSTPASTKNGLGSCLVRRHSRGGDPCGRLSRHTHHFRDSMTPSNYFRDFTAPPNHLAYPYHTSAT